jgi:stage II sporulation protein B
VNKLNSGKTITIKINGEKRAFLEEPAKEMPQEVENNNLQVYDPGKNEPGVLEETAASQEAEESFDWILPEQEIVETELSLSKMAKGSKQRKGIRLPALANAARRNESTLKSFIISGIFAVLLGTGFGFVMLKLVITDGSKQAAVTKKAEPAVHKETPVTNNNSTVVTALKPLTAVMVQGGVFSKKETAKTITNQASEIGIPAEMIEWNGQYYIFLGVADSLQNARSLASLYQKKGMDGVFAKTITIPEKKLSNLSSDEKNFIEIATAAVPIIANLSANPLTGGAISSNELKSLSEFKLKLAKIDNKGIKTKKIVQLKQEITGAINGINDYHQKKGQKFLENAQQHLLTFLAIYDSLK